MLDLDKANTVRSEFFALPIYCEFSISELLASS